MYYIQRANNNNNITSFVRNGTLRKRRWCIGNKDPRVALIDGGKGGLYYQICIGVHIHEHKKTPEKGSFVAERRTRNSHFTFRAGSENVECQEKGIL